MISNPPPPQLRVNLREGGCKNSFRLSTTRTQRNLSTNKNTATRDVIPNLKKQIYNFSVRILYCKVLTQFKDFAKRVARSRSNELVGFGVRNAIFAPAFDIKAIAAVTPRVARAG